MKTFRSKANPQSGQNCEAGNLFWVSCQLISIKAQANSLTFLYILDSQGTCPQGWSHLKNVSSTSLPSRFPTLPELMLAQAAHTKWGPCWVTGVYSCTELRPGFSRWPPAAQVQLSCACRAASVLCRSLFEAAVSHAFLLQADSRGTSNHFSCAVFLSPLSFLWTLPVDPGGWWPTVSTMPHVVFF